MKDFMSHSSTEKILKHEAQIQVFHKPENEIWK